MNKHFIQNVTNDQKWNKLFSNVPLKWIINNNKKLEKMKTKIVNTAGLTYKITQILEFNWLWMNV